MVVNGDRIRVVAQRDPTKLPWGELGVDVVLECTGLFTSKAKASAHLTAGAKKVVISAPGGEDVDATIVYGVNHGVLKAAHTVISNASCTTNCLAPLVKVLHEKIGDSGGGDEHHSLLHQRSGADRRLSLGPAPRALGDHVDDPDQDGRRRRRRPGAARAEGQDRRVRDSRADHQCLAGRSELHGGAQDHGGGDSLRWSRRPPGGALKGVLAYNDAPLVSVDFNHDPASSTYDATLTKVIEGTLVKVCAWYDNEWGFSNRMLDTDVAWSKAV